MTLDDLQNKIEQKLGALSISLDALQDQKKYLIENSDKVKNSINASSDKQVNALKLRERQLIRQVEVVTAHQNSLLDSQIAKLLQIKGSLSSTQEILKHCKPEEIETVSGIYEGYISSLKPVSPVKLVAVQMDEKHLSSSISNFGKVLLPDIMAYEHSSVIPSKVEDYGDSEHDVLHKSIGGNGSHLTVEENVIRVQFPKIPSNGWLATPQRKNNGPNTLQRKLSRDVSSWLADLRLSQNLEETKTGSSFDLVEDYLECASPPSLKGKSRTSSVSSSIEIVPYLDQEKDSCCRSNNDMNNFKSCFSSGMGADSRKICSPLPVSIEEFACQANEPCDSYDDCLCDGYCKDLALERATQTSKWLIKEQLAKGNDEKKIVFPVIKFDSPQKGVKRKLSPTEGRDEVLKHMKDILSSDDKKWLSRRESPKKQQYTQPESKRFCVSYNPSVKSWLCTSPTSVTKVSNSESNHVRFSPHSNIWLLHKLKEQKSTNCERNTSIKECSESEPEKATENSVTVLDLKEALSDVSAFVQSYSPTSWSLRPKINYTEGTETDGGSDIHRKLKWLSKSQSSNPVPGRVDIISRTPSSLPESLVALAESRLDKWLLNRF